VQVDVDGYKIKPVVIGESKNLHVGQSCFAIGNPYGYENTLTTGVISLDKLNPTRQTFIRKPQNLLRTLFDHTN